MAKSDVTIKININTDDAQTAIKKMNQLKSLLRQANEMIDSLANELQIDPSAEN